MKKILLRGAFEDKKRHFAIVDDEDFSRVNNYRWEIRDNYALTGYTTDDYFKCLGMHRFIMGLQRGDKREVDHINHNGLDNRKCNLRVCCRSENSKNMRVDKNRDLAKGVVRSGKKYYSQIVLNGKKIYLGTFKTERAAAIAYNLAAKKYHKEFACLNNVEAIK